MQVTMQSTSASAAFGKHKIVTRGSCRPLSSVATSIRGTRRPFLRETQLRRPRASHAGACRPDSFVGSRWGNAGPAGFRCGGTITSEDCYRMAQEFEKAMFGGTASGRGATTQVSVAVDVSETADAYLFTTDLPGVQRADTMVQANRQDRVLTLSGERPAPIVPEGQKDTRRRSERRFGKFLRTFKLPEDAELSKITASFKDGVLTVSVARVQPTEPEVVNVPVDEWIGGDGGRQP